jgi:hypothetical protein
MKILEVAKRYVGQSEFPGNKFTDQTPLGKLVHSAGQKDGEAWCAYFVEGCAVEAFPERRKEIEKLFDASAVKTFTNAKKLGYVTTVTDPLPGDIAVFQKYAKGIKQWQGHMCIVEVVKPGDGFLTVDGNTNVAGSREGTTVLSGKKKTFKFNPDGLTLLGFIRL